MSGISIGLRKGIVLARRQGLALGCEGGCGRRPQGAHPEPPDRKKGGWADPREVSVPESLSPLPRNVAIDMLISDGRATLGLRKPIPSSVCGR